MKMTEQEVRSAVQKRFAAAHAGYLDLQTLRNKAFDCYYGRPLGNEIDGRAQVVTKDMMDTIEWMMPSLMRVFMTKNSVQFDAVGPEDEQAAKQESEYINHVFWKQNNGFMVLYQWIKEALMGGKVAYVQYRWEEDEKVCFEEYTGLTQDQLVMVMQEAQGRGEVEVVEAEAEHTAPGVPQTWDIKLKVKSEYGKALVENIPGEEVIVSADCRGSVKEAKFAGRIRRLTRSALLEMGFKRKEVNELTDFSWDDQSQRTSRDAQSRVETMDEGVDWATTEVVVLDCYTTLDSDDDGYAELRHFIMGGNSTLEDVEVDEIQMESWTPIPIPHKHAGLDIYDLMEDLQRIHTALVRGMLDSTYYTMNPRMTYDKNRVTSVQQLMLNRPGAHVAIDGDTTGAVMPIFQPDQGPRLLPVIQFTQDMMTRRTGVSDAGNGLDADALSQSTKGAYLNAMTAASQRIEAIARIFAETGMAPLFRSLHKLLSKHQDWPTKFKLRNDWATVNPTEWIERTDLTVSVGLGTAGKEEVRNNLMLLGQTLQTAAQVPGLVQPQNVYSFVRRLQVELGLESENFITDPASQEYQQFVQQSQQQAPDPYLEAEKMKAQGRTQEKLIDSHDKALDRAAQRDKWITELEVNTAVDLAKPGIGAEVSGGPAGNRPKGPSGPGATVQ